MNGYTDWNNYNVAVWMHNDKKLYTLMISTVQKSKSLLDAVNSVYETLNNANRPGAGVSHTPDGALYTYSAIREAMEGQELEEFLSA